MMVIRIALIFVVGLLILGCTRRKKSPGNISDWLEVHFPGRFEVLDTRISDPFRNLSFKVKKSVVAEKSDTLLQILVDWDARQPDLELSVAAIEEQVASAKPILADVRRLSALVREQSAFPRVSVGIWNGSARVLIFEEPTPERRKQALTALKPALQAWEAAEKYGIQLVFMEPAAYGAEFADIVPLAHWVRPDSWQSRHTLVDFSMEPEADFKVASLNKQWKFNTNSDRLLDWTKRAQPMAEQWAASHLKKKVYFLSEMRYSSLENQLGAQLEFPYAYQPNDSIVGYIQGDFLLDADVFENLRAAGAE